MLFHSLFWVCFLAILVSQSDTREKLSTDTEKPETIFADVIKNISRVNSVLQELINNYEQLQKLYKSQENFDAPEYSSETEIDRYFQNNKKSIRDKERSFQKYPASTMTTAYLHGTQMIFDENEDKSPEAKTSRTIETTAKTPRVERQILDRKPSTTKTTPEIKMSLSSDESTSSEESIESTTKTTKATTKATTTTENVVKPRQPHEAEIIFVDTHKKMQEKKNRKIPRIMPEIALEQVAKKKTRYSVKEMPGNKDASYGVVKRSKYPRESRNTSKSTSKRDFEMELLRTNEAPSEEDITIKPKQKLTAEKVTIVKPVETKVSVNLRSHLNSTKTANNKTANVFIVRKGDDLGISSEMTDDDAALTKDLFKTSVLRQAYGDACLKLVVRKCYKACKQVLKSSCRAIKCKSQMKSFFKSHYKGSCDKAFDDTPEAFRRILKTEGVHADLTRAGYLSVACQPRAESGLAIMLKNEPQLPGNDQKNDKEINILRDRYEKACSKISQDKCRSACNYAQNATCVKFECGKNLKKNFRRNCGLQCKRAYMSKGGSGSESGSGSNSGSESDDSDSES